MATSSSENPSTTAVPPAPDPHIFDRLIPTSYPKFGMREWLVDVLRAVKFKQVTLPLFAIFALLGVSAKLIYTFVPTRLNHLISASASINYPLEPNPIPFPKDLFYAFVCPWGVLTAATRVIDGGPRDIAKAFYGYISAFCAAMFVNVVLKKIIGGVRPHFLSLCKPDWNRETLAGRNVRDCFYPMAYGPFQMANGSTCPSYAYVREVCTAKLDDPELLIGLESFPSGHATAFWCSTTFVSLYLFNKLRRHKSPMHHPALGIVYLMTIVSLLSCAVIASAAMVFTYWHSVTDVVAGAVIGIVCTCVAYAMAFDGATPRLGWREEESPA